jgi:hypothetical protein
LAPYNRPGVQKTTPVLYGLYIETNPFTYGSPLSPGEAIRRPTETRLLLQMALSGQNTRICAPRRYGKTTLIEDVRVEAEKQGLNTVRVDLYGVLSRADVALRLEGAYRSLRGPIQRSLDALLPRTRLKASARAGPAKLEAELAAAGELVDRFLIELLDLPARFFSRKAVRTLIVFDEFQDVLQAGDGVDAVIRSRIQHQREAASYVFAGSHPGMMDELFGDRNRPLFDQARPVVLQPLGDLVIAEYVEERFLRTSRSAGRQLDAITGLAGGHPQRAMMLAHRLWEHTPRGEHATEDTWRGAVASVFADLQEQYERAWSSVANESERGVLAAAAAGRPVLAVATLRRFGLSKSGAVRARDRLLRAGELWRDGDNVRLVDPLYAAWIEAGRRSPWSRVARRPSSPALARGDSDGLVYPFGSPDGAQASLGDLARSLVEFDDAPGLHAARVIVGRNGAGKTLWLRRLAMLASSDRSRYAAGPDYQTPTTVDVVRVAEGFPQAYWIELWSRVWRVALLRSVASHVLHAPALRHHLGARRQLALATRFESLWPRFDGPRSPNVELINVLRGHDTPQGLERYVGDPDWQNAERLIEEILRDCPPLYLYLDAMDELFAEAPRHWLAYQRGLHVQVRRQLTSYLGPRLHLVVTMRDIAYLSMFSGEHATRYLTDRHVHMLRWDAPRARRLLDAKIAALDERHLLRPENGATIEGWLGHDRIHNVRRDTTEQLGDYLLRHTRQIPRDVVALGNMLSRGVEAAKQQGRHELPHEVVRKAVVDATLTFGREQLTVCANQIAAELASADAHRSDHYGIVTEGPSHERAYAEMVAEELRVLLRGIQTDRFGVSRMSKLRVRIEASQLASADVLSALWQNRLLGYVDGPTVDAEVVFFEPDPAADMTLPPSKRGYALHPILIDVVGLRPVGRPVAPSG